VIQMYCEGVCPDYSYSFSGKPPPTASLILKYIESKMVTVIPDNMKVDEKMSTKEKLEKRVEYRREGKNELEIEKLERIEKSKRTVQQLELELFVRKETVHSLRVAMNCKSDFKSEVGSSMSQAENARRYQKSLSLLHARVAVSKTPFK
jgi:hypothetical protein